MQGSSADLRSMLTAFRPLPKMVHIDCRLTDYRPYIDCSIDHIVPADGILTGTLIQLADLAQMFVTRDSFVVCRSIVTCDAAS